MLTVLGREVEPLFRAHLEALRQFYHGKFQDKFSGLYLPVKQYDKEASHMVQDICLTFSKAAKAAVPPQMAHRWDITGSMEQLKEDLDEEVADRRLEVRTPSIAMVVSVMYINRLTNGGGWLSSW